MIHPGLEPYVRAAQQSPPPPPSSVTPLERRAAYREFAATLRGELEPMAEVRDVQLALEGRTLPARLFVPFRDEHRSLVVFFHGGSFVAGDIETHEPLCRRLAADTRTPFLSVEYRLAPEHPFPAAVEDAVGALRYVAAHVGDFASPSARVIAMGESAGATLAAVAAALTRRDNLGLAAQVLISPTLGPDVVTDSAHEFARGYLLDVDQLRYDYAQYVGDFSDRTDPRLSPLMFDDLVGAPPAIVLVAQCDPLRDEGVAYAGLLEHFKVPVELLEAEGMVHGFLRMGSLVPDTLAIIDDLAAHMSRYVEHAS